MLLILYFTIYKARLQRLLPHFYIILLTLLLALIPNFTKISAAEILTKNYLFCPKLLTNTKALYHGLAFDKVQNIVHFFGLTYHILYAIIIKHHIEHYM